MALSPYSPPAIDDHGQARFTAWRMVVLASLIHNLSFGLAYGMFGVSVLAIEQRFGTTRGTTSLVLSLIIAATVISAPLLGILYGRISVRRSMMLGSLLGAAGYLCLAVTTDWSVMLACYAFLVGPGVALCGAMPTNVLVANWFHARQGIALGIVNLPLGMMIAPLVGTAILRESDLTILYIGMGLLFLTIVPAAWATVDRPKQAEQRQFRRVAESAAASRAPDARSGKIAEILRRWEFWMLALSIGVIIGGNTMKVGQMVPLLTEQGHSAEEASALLALSGGAGAVGSLLLGWLADRIGGARVLIVIALIQAAMWCIFLLPASIPLLTFDAILIGICGGGVPAVQGVLIARRFGNHNFGLVLGLLGLFAVPFLIGTNPLAGYLRDFTGDYRLAVMTLIAASGGVAVMLIALARGERREPGACATHATH